MTLKKRVATFVQGWLPKEPNLPIYQGAGNHKSWRAWFVGLVIMGAFAGGLLGALGYFLGLASGVGVYVWSMITGMTIGITAAAILIRIKQRS
jgi:hypothetical protein